MPEPAEIPRAPGPDAPDLDTRDLDTPDLRTRNLSPRKLALVIGVTVGVLLLAALASAIDLPDDNNESEQDRSDQTAANSGGVDQGGVDQGGTNQGGVDQGGVDQGGVDQGGVDQGGVDQGSEGASGGAGGSGGFDGGASGRIDIGDGRGFDVQPVPGCPGGFALGDDILIVPDPEACGFQALPPGATGFESSGKTILVPDAEGSIGGFRLGPDGIELVGPGDLGAGDFVIGSLPDGSFGLVRPDGSAVEIVPGDDGLTLRDPEHGSTDFVPSPGVGFGTQIPPSATQEVPQPAADTNDDSSAFPVRLVLVIMGVLAALAAALWYWNRRSAPAQASNDMATPESYAAEIDAIDRLLWEIDQEADPRTAIRKVYAALETGLGNPSMARRQPETPGVFLQRLLGRIDGLNRPLQELVVLFEHARFSEHEITTDMRDRARRSLGEIRGRYAAAGADHGQLVNVS